MRQVACLYEKSRILESEIAVVGCDHVVGEFYAEQASGELKLPGDSPILDARPRVSRRMIVPDYDAMRVIEERALENLAHVDQGRVQSPYGDEFTADQSPPRVEVQPPEVFAVEAARQRAQNFIGVLGRANDPPRGKSRAHDP